MGVSGGPYIVRDSSLVLELDAADRNSYPGTGTTWRDLTANSNNGTLTNGPTFSSTNGGSIVFDGTNDYVDLNSNNIIAGVTPFTIESFYKITGATEGAIFTNFGNGYGTGVWFAGRYGIYLNGNVYAVGAPLPLGTYHMIATRNELGNIRLYINGLLNNTGTLTGNIPSNINFRIGSDVNGFGEQLTGNLYSLRVYNRALSAQEVLQNYNQLKSRFNL
jgi:hypothetical protein